MTPVFRGLAVILTALGLWLISLVLIGLIAKLTFLGLMAGWKLI